MVDISDVFIIEGGQVSVEGFAFAPFVFVFYSQVLHIFVLRWNVEMAYVSLIRRGQAKT